MTLVQIEAQKLVRQWEDHGQLDVRKAVEMLRIMAHPKPFAPAKYDDTLVPFVALMRRELHNNTAKGDRPGWIKMTTGEALNELHYHVGKLHYSVRKAEGHMIVEHAADVANCSMMLLDVCTPGGLK